MVSELEAQTGSGDRLAQEKLVRYSSPRKFCALVFSRSDFRVVLVSPGVDASWSLDDVSDLPVRAFYGGVNRDQGIIVNEYDARFSLVRSRDVS
jgi:hypothetical protein